MTGLEPHRPDVGALETGGDATELQDLIAEFLEGSRVGAVVLDRDSRILWVSRTFERFFAVRRDDLVGRDFDRLLASGLGGAFAEPEAVVASLSRRGGGAPEPFECRVLAGDDRRRRWLEAWSQPIRSGRHAGGRIDYYYEVTERRQAEEAARRSEDQVIQAQKMEAVGRLAGGLAHDFNNLLTAINGYTDLIVRITDDERLQSYVGEIKKAGDRAAELTAKLLTLSKPPPSQRRVADLNQVVLSLKGLLQPLIGEDVQLETSLAPEPRRVRIDPGQLEQVLLNLAVNARDAMPTGGRLRLESTGVDESEALPLGLEAGAYVCVMVSDTGVGIDDGVREHIFEPFFTTKKEGKGTGLGLSTVYAAVTQNRGHIAVDSTPGAGTTFRLYLPSAEDEAESEPARRDADAPEGGDEKILLVEDDATVRKLVRKLLEHQGYAVTSAKNAAEALEVIDDLGGAVELLITDVVMPGMSGPDLAERLVRRYPRVQVLFISGYTDSLVLRHGLLDAEHVMLQKPFDGQMLAVKVRELLDQPR